MVEHAPRGLMCAATTALLSEGIMKSMAAWLNASRTVAFDHHHLTARGDQRQSRSHQRHRGGRRPPRRGGLAQEEREELEPRRKETTETKPANEDEQEAVREQKQRVQYVGMLPNNMRWERAHDPSKGLIVRVNMAHRPNIDVIQVAQENAQLITVLDVFLYSLARAEYDLVYKTDLLIRMRPARSWTSSANARAPRCRRSFD